MHAEKKLLINFTPHLVPMNSGILVTAYATLKKDVTLRRSESRYDKYYQMSIRACPGQGCMPADKMGRGQQLCGCQLQDRSENKRESS